MTKKMGLLIRRFKINLLALSILCLIVMTTGCAASHKSSSRLANASDTAASETDFDSFEDELAGKAVTIADPIEPWNRLMFGLNDCLYFWILKPVAQGYKVILPEPARIGIRNFFHNLTTPVRVVNCALQGKFHSAGNEINRCVINTTIGFAGFCDPALEGGKIKPTEEDLGQTLAVYGLGDGCYLVWPLLGPSTARDSAGKFGDLFLSPIYYIQPDEHAFAVGGAGVINDTSLRIGEYEAFKEAAVDPYIALRNIYIQYRSKQIKE